MKKLRRFGALAAGSTLALSVSLVPVTPAQAATNVTWTHTYNNGGTLTASNAGVTLGCMYDGKTVSYGTNGSTLGTTAAAQNGCGGVQVDKAGNSFVLSGVYTHTPVITSYTAAGAVRWSVGMPKLCDNQSDTEQRLTNLTVGGDGNVYAALTPYNVCSDGSAERGAFVSFSGSTGALRFSSQDERGYYIGVQGMYPYKSGVLVVGPTSSAYFSYDGVFVSSFLNGPDGQMGVAGVTSDGTALLVKSGYQDGCYEAGTLEAVDAYTPWGHKWHIDPQIDCSAEISVKAMPDGGFTIFAAKRHTTQPYDVYETQVHRYTPSGDQTWFVTLQQPLVHVLASASPDHLIGVDVNGNILVVRHYSYGVTNGQPNQPNNVQVVKLTDAAGSNNHQTIVADTLDSGHPGTYDAPLAATLGMGNGQVYLAAYNSCQGVPNCTPSQMLFAFNVTGVGLDAPRAQLWSTALVTAGRPFAAIGDSYISGEGDNQDGFVTERGACHLSNSAWPIRAGGDTRLNLTLMGFPACSGATTHDMWFGGSGQPQQLYTLGSPASVVAVSAGGNNIGFKDLIIACILSTCKSREAQTLANISKLSDTTSQSSLASFYAELKYSVGPNADIYVMEYPLVLPSTSCSTTNLGVNAFITALKNSAFKPGLTAWLSSMGISATQVLADSDKGALTFDATEAAVAKNVTTQLNAKIESIIAARHDPKFHYVRANYTGGPFEGHTLCSSTPYFNGFFIDSAHPSALVGNISMSYHPNHGGTQAYKDVFVNCRLNRTNCN